MFNLIKDHWSKDDIKKFEDYLYSLRREDKIVWTKNIVMTNKKVLAITSDILKMISKQISEGNYLSFLDNMPHTYHEETIIDAYLINKIKDINLQKKYILKLSKYTDSWSTVDTFKYKVKNHEEEHLSIAQEFIHSDDIFQKRIGVRILFSFVKKDEYTQRIFEFLKELKNEDEYYVNMACAWLICELFIYKKNPTFNFIKSKSTNKFVINKAISKCCDSYRISKIDKDALKKYRVN